MFRLENSQQHIVYRNDGTLIMDPPFYTEEPILIGTFDQDNIRDCVARMEAIQNRKFI